MIISEDKRSPNTYKKRNCNVILNYLDNLCVYYLDTCIRYGNMCLQRQQEGKGRGAIAQLSQSSQNGQGESSSKNNGMKLRKETPDPGEHPGMQVSSQCFHLLSSLENLTKTESKSKVGQIQCPVASLNFSSCCQFVSLKDV